MLTIPTLDLVHFKNVICKPLVTALSRRRISPGKGLRKAVAAERSLACMAWEWNGALSCFFTTHENYLF